jgi:hypothetical protein
LGCVTLKAIKTEIEECYELARGCAEKAKAEADPQRRQEFLDMERRWLFLARSYEFTERLGGVPMYSEFPGSESGSETGSPQKRVPVGGEPHRGRGG